MKKITITTAKQVFNTSIRDVLKPFMEDPRVKDLLLNENDIDLRSVEGIDDTLLRVSWTDIEYATPTGLIVCKLQLADEGCVTLDARVDAYYEITHNVYLGYRDRIESIEYSTASVCLTTYDNLKSRLKRLGIPEGVSKMFIGGNASKKLVDRGVIAKGATSYRKQQL